MGFKVHECIVVNFPAGAQKNTNPKVGILIASRATRDLIFGQRI